MNVEHPQGGRKWETGETERLCPGPLGFEEESSLTALGLETKPWIQGPMVHVSRPLASVNESVLCPGGHRAREAVGLARLTTPCLMPTGVWACWDQPGFPQEAGSGARPQALSEGEREGECQEGRLRKEFQGNCLKQNGTCLAPNSKKNEENYS